MNEVYTHYYYYYYYLKKPNEYDDVIANFEASENQVSE